MQVYNYIRSVWFPANLTWSAAPASGVNHLPISKNHLRIIPNSVFVIRFSHLEVQAIFLHRSITHCICPACPLQYIESSRFTFFTFWYHFQNSTRGAHPAYWGVGSWVNWKPQTWRSDKNRTGWSQHKIAVSIFAKNYAYTNNQVKATVILCQLPLLTCLTRKYLTSELSPSLSTPGWTTAVKSSSKIWTTFEWYIVNLRSTSTQTYLYVVMISQRYGRIGCTSCFMWGADLITLITHLPHVACHIDTNPALNHGTITIAISKWCHGDSKPARPQFPPQARCQFHKGWSGCCENCKPYTPAIPNTYFAKSSD